MSAERDSFTAEVAANTSNPIAIGRVPTVYFPLFMYYQRYRYFRDFLFLEGFNLRYLGITNVSVLP